MNPISTLLIAASFASPLIQEASPDDPNLPILERIRRVRAAASSLDDEARKKPRLDERIAAWERAARLLDDFNAKEPRHPQVRALLAQAESYRWGIANAWMAAARQASDRRPEEEKARTILNGIISRLRPLIDTATRSDAVESALRLRLAMSLADRASLSAGRAAKEDWGESWKVLEKASAEPTIAGALAMTQARALNGLGRFAEALGACDRAASARPAPAEEELLPIRTDAWIGLRRFNEGATALAGSKAEPERHWQSVRLLLAQWAAPADLPKLARGLTASVAALRKAKAHQEQLALAAIGKVIDEPPMGADAAFLSLLADAKKAVGQAETAGDLYLRAAEAAGEKEAPAFRLRAAAAWAMGPRAAEADRILGELVGAADGGGTAIQANALRAWLRGRAWGQDPTPERREAYVSVLREQIGRFPNDPAASDARWDLSRVLSSEGKTQEAIAIWSEIPNDHPRWPDSRLAGADRMLADIGLALRAEDAKEAERIAQALRDWLDKARDEAKAEAIRVDLDLKRARLEVMRDVGAPNHALVLCERILRGLLTPERRARARLWQAVALCSLNRNEEARALVGEIDFRGIADDFRAALGALDRFAVAVMTKVQRERAGELMVDLIGQYRKSQQPEPSEIRIREIRGLLHAHRTAEAIIAVREQPIPPDGLPDALLADLADAQISTNEYVAAEQTQEARTRLAPRGSRPWLEARFGVAEALHHQGRDREARQLVETTAILYPELGGGLLRLRFETLRRVLAH